MSNDTSPLLSDHAYDGIQEYDNPLPGWWSFLFAATCLFSVFYWLYFHLGTPGRTIHDELDLQTARIMELRFSEIGNLTPDRATLLKYMRDSEWLVAGKAVFKSQCVSCHGQQGEGLVGPNLTDDHWKNVNRIEDIVKVIQEGAANGAMPSFRHRLTHVNQLVLVSAYVASLRGQHLPSPREPEGKEIPAWE